MCLPCFFIKSVIVHENMFDTDSGTNTCIPEQALVNFGVSV